MALCCFWFPFSLDHLTNCVGICHRWTVTKVCGNIKLASSWAPERCKPRIVQYMKYFVFMGLCCIVYMHWIHSAVPWGILHVGPSIKFCINRACLGNMANREASCVSGEVYLLTDRESEHTQRQRSLLVRLSVTREIDLVHDSPIPQIFFLKRLSQLWPPERTSRGNS